MRGSIFWFGLLAPKGTSREVVEKLNVAVRTALTDPQVSKAHLSLGFSGAGNSPEEFSRIIASDYQKWGKVLAKMRQ